MIPFSVLDLSPINAGATASEALANSLALARQAEAQGFRRFWLAEHHNMPGIASAATAVVIGHVAGGTRSIRVGSGGIMLPNHVPYVIAEQFGTLAALYPGRIDLGLGRAPGTDPLTTRALRRDPHAGVDGFPRDVQEVQAWFAPAEPGQRVRAIPGAGLEVPLWILGSSLYGARLAAALGLPYVFAAHFAPQDLAQALALYRAEFRPSAQLARPYVMIGVAVLAADTDETAAYHFTSQLQAFANVRRGMPAPLPPPCRDLAGFWRPGEEAGIRQVLKYSFVGSPRTVEAGLRPFLESFRPDELIITAHVHDQPARLRSLELVAEVRHHLLAEALA